MDRSAEVRLADALAGKGKFAGLDPSHAAYVLMQNRVSELSEQLTRIPDVAPLRKIIAEAEDYYCPSAPPMSPLTTSYFTCWAFFDACSGPFDETIGIIAWELGTAFGMHPEYLRLIREMQLSRMGLYVNEGSDDGLVVLADLATGAEVRASCPAGYLGRKGEIWYVRVLPPPFPDRTAHVVYTTPYVVVTPGLAEWIAYLHRALRDNPNATTIDYELHMKFGPTRSYWNDWVFDGYVNHRPDVIFLAGVPDVPESRPNSLTYDGRYRGFIREPEG